MAGGGPIQISGRIVASQNLTGIAALDLEQSDVLDTSNPSQIVFDFSSAANEVDEFTFSFPEQASINLVLDNPADTVLLSIGNQRWPVNNNPVDISGW